jgi:hypothetical protein
VALPYRKKTFQLNFGSGCENITLFDWHAYLEQVAQDLTAILEVNLQDAGQGLLVDSQEATKLTDPDCVWLWNVADYGDIAGDVVGQEL